jgi:hypothetical protein
MDDNPYLYVHANWAAVAELIAVGVGCIITVSMSLLRANLQGTIEGRRNGWPWLLLLSGILLNWELSTIVLSLNLVPVWFFVGLTLALIGAAVLVRERFGSYWASPIDVLVLGDAFMALSLSLNQSADRLSALLLGFAALFYAVVLYQRRQRWLFLPLVFAGSAVLLPSNPFWVLAVVAPTAAILGFGVSRSFDRTWASPLYIVALPSTIMTGIVGYQNPAQFLATSWILLGFGLLSYAIGLLEGLEPCLWLLPAFTIWALVDAAQLGDLYRPPIIALLYAGFKPVVYGGLAG